MEYNGMKERRRFTKKPEDVSKSLGGTAITIRKRSERPPLVGEGSLVSPGLERLGRRREGREREREKESDSEGQCFEE